MRGPPRPFAGGSRRHGSVGLRRRPSRPLAWASIRPDEFQVVSQAPLSMPPDFNLPPPTPGAPAPAGGLAGSHRPERAFGQRDHRRGHGRDPGCKTSLRRRAGLAADRWRRHGRSQYPHHGQSGGSRGDRGEPAVSRPADLLAYARARRHHRRRRRPSSSACSRMPHSASPSPPAPPRSSSAARRPCSRAFSDGAGPRPRRKWFSCAGRAHGGQPCRALARIAPARRFACRDAAPVLRCSMPRPPRSPMGCRWW